MRTRTLLAVGLALGLVTAVALPARAQLGGGLPGGPLADLGRAGQRVGETLETLTDPLGDRVATTLSDAGTLARGRVERLARFVEVNRNSVDWDENRQPSVRGEVLLTDPDAAAIESARRAGFGLIEEGAIDGLDLHFARLSVPSGMSLAEGVRHLRKLIPGREISADQIHFPAGQVDKRRGQGTPPSAALPRGGTVGVIDGGIAGSARLVAQRAFAGSAAVPSDHASAIASLLAGSGTARIVGADVYGSAASGGNALAIARALGWMRQLQVQVVSISLVGPANPLLGRAVASVQAQGMLVVAAVGNDGAAAPPAYPASYPGVVAVTGVDGAGRVLIEAGRASHLDYAAPGADMSALVPGKGRVSLRGTSYAAPLVASRLAARRASGAADGRAALSAADGEALARSKRTGRGVLCNICRSGL